MKTQPLHPLTWWKPLRERAFKLYGRRCIVCGHTGSRDNPLQVDHCLPRSIYPRYERKLWNLQPMCRNHNQAKSYKHWNDFRPWKGHAIEKFLVLQGRMWFEFRRKY